MTCQGTCLLAGIIRHLHLKFLLGTSLEDTLNMANTQVLDSQKKISFSACYRVQWPLGSKGWAAILWCYWEVVELPGGGSHGNYATGELAATLSFSSISSVCLSVLSSIMCCLATIANEYVYSKPCPLQWCSASSQIPQQQIQPAVTESPETMSRK